MHSYYSSLHTIMLLPMIVFVYNFVEYILIVHVEYGIYTIFISIRCLYSCFCYMHNYDDYSLGKQAI